MKTNLLLLDTLKNLDNLIYSGFSFSNELKRKLKIAYVYDFSWLASGEYMGLGATAPNIDASIHGAEREFRQDFDIAEAEIKKAVTDYLKDHPQNVPYEIKIVEISKVTLVEDVMKEEEDLLVMMSNYNSYSRFMPGTINYPDVIDDFPCPVLIIPDDVQNIAFNKCLYATAFHPEDLTALDHFVHLFDGTDGEEIIVFHNEKAESFEGQMKWNGFEAVVRDRVQNVKLKFKITHEKDVRHGLKNMIEKEDPDIVVLLKEQRGFFEELFSGSDTHFAVTHFNKPILVYHEEYLKEK
ncbi:MAG TPA: hypothetical protein VKA27_11050 [Sunxiuqinia sp.]|nr:hypothetical protein [Sunxiuqinia sp.]